MCLIATDFETLYAFRNRQIVNYMQPRNLLILSFFIAFLSSANTISQESFDAHVCHVDNKKVKKIQLKAIDSNILGDCEVGDVLSIYMGGANHRPEWFIATVARLCEVGTVALSNGTNQNIATCLYRGKILDIK